MKKVILILLCFAMLVVAISCGKNDKISLETSYNENSNDEISDALQSVQDISNRDSAQPGNVCSTDNGKEISSVDYSNINNLPEHYLQIIKNEKPFLLMGEKMLIDNYKSPYLQKYLNQCDNAQYVVLDMDEDGKVELLISGWTSDILVLHEENGIIYGVDFTFRGMYNVKTDGSYCWNSNQGKTYGCSKLSFKNGTCSEVELSRVEHGDNGIDVFFVNGIEVTNEEYGLLTESHLGVDNITWYKLSIFPKNIGDKG